MQHRYNICLPYEKGCFSFSFFCSVSKNATCFVLTSCAHMDRTRASKTGERKRGCKVKGSFNTTKMKMPQMKTNVILFHCFYIYLDN